jgi:hypothetical protein
VNKKRVAELLIAGFILSSIVTACGNKRLIDTNHTFTKAVVVIGSEVKTFDIKTWKALDKDTQIQIVTSEGRVYLVDKSNITLMDK